MQFWPSVIPWCMELSNWSTLAHGDIYGAFSLLLNSWSELLCRLLLAMVGTAILVALNTWRTVHSCHSTRIAAWSQPSGFLSTRIWMVFFVGANTVPSCKWLKRFVTISVLFQSPIFSWWSGEHLFLMVVPIIQKTKMGKAMRTVSVASDAAHLMGDQRKRTISFTFALGSAWQVLVVSWLVCITDRAFDGEMTIRFLSQPFWRNRNHSRCCSRWTVIGHWKLLRYSDRSSFQTSVMPLCMPGSLLHPSSRYPR